jgi:hypothetical protein
MTWHDLRDLAVLCGKEYVTQRRQAVPTAKSRFPISCVLCDVDSGRKEQLFHLESFDIERLGVWQTVHRWDNVSSSDSVCSAIWEAFPAQSSSVFMRQTRFSLRECGCFSLGRSTNIPNDDVRRLVPMVQLGAAWCWWCCLVPLGADGAASSEDSAHKSVRKWTAELKKYRVWSYMITWKSTCRWSQSDHC